ncbi:uncharacterized protein MELLADRAFT_57451 [Melampsora larici-populina 98AG31]|uniref:Uncharacterized protein n=1 Tax=Melampsora larici-populina (strain 98AG31 / pathotype 3-4-7) TaxID=747676 RepID=F4S2C2_MELLP|nr:uncharacterized protein MELLADRAFT_57451 [Melampsora larici-populina 98AG31]EGG01227.1 hypothetical protein MELLADRAFT_57451 [Melampsora larici-populina 98AG31]
MSADTIAGFLAVFESVRHQPRPYSALSDYLASIAVLPRWKGGVVVLPFSSIILNFILLITAVGTCFVKIRCKTFHLGSINQDRILRPNSAVCFALGCIVYSLCEYI